MTPGKACHRTVCIIKVSLVINKILYTAGSNWKINFSESKISFISTEAACTYFIPVSYQKAAGNFPDKTIETLTKAPRQSVTLYNHVPSPFKVYFASLKQHLMQQVLNFFLSGTDLTSLRPGPCCSKHR